MEKIKPMIKIDSKQEPFLKEAEHFFQQGNFTQALKCFRQLDLNFDHPNDVIGQRIHACLKQLLRKYWRQKKTDQMAQIMKELAVEQELALCYARLLGREAVVEIANKANGIQSKLAQCSLQEDLKSALLSLRQLPELKTIAEGWLALLKGDHERAFISFEQAEAQTPLYAKIGKGVVYLIKGDMQKACIYLEFLKPFASSHFPVLFKEMGWGEDLIEENENKLSFYLFSASLEELKQAERRLSPQQTKIKGWLWLRMGDYLVLKSPKEAILAWDKAKRLNSDLILDELKRRFLLSCQADCSINPADAFQAFYRKLVNLIPRDAKEFVEYLIFESHQFLGFFKAEDLKKNGKWMIDPPPIELQFLWFHIFYQENIYPMFQLLFLTPEVKKGILFSWKEWDSLFQVLDVEYGKRESYLRQKLGIACLYEEDQVARSVIVQLLQLNTMLKDELLPLYVQKTLSKLLAQSITRDEKEELGRQIDSLRHFWSSDYDLIRLSILANVSDKSQVDLMSALSIHLSEPLRQVLQFQIAIDLGWSTVRCLNLLPDKSLYQRDREFDWRLLVALFNPAFKILKRDLESLLSLLISHTSSRHELFSKIALYGVSVPFSLLKKWQKQTQNGWEPDYHLALYYKSKKDFDKFLLALRRADYRIPKDAKEAILIQRTLECYLGLPTYGDIAPDFLFQLLEELFNQ